MSPDGRPKGSGVVSFESVEDARNAITQFNGYDWDGRMIEVREDRFAASPSHGGGGRGGSGYGGRGGGGGSSYGGRGGAYGASRGTYDGGSSFGGGSGFSSRPAYGASGYDSGGVEAAPNPFTDDAVGGGDKGPIIFVRNVRRHSISPFSLATPPVCSIHMLVHGLIAIASMVDEQRGLGRAICHHWQGRACRDAIRAQRSFQGHWRGRVRLG